MCKILVLTNTSKLSKKQLGNLIGKGAKEVSKYEQDGFGFAYSTTSGIYAERWVNPDEFLMRDVEGGPVDNLLCAPPEANSIGDPKAPHRGGLILHGRTSTNNVSLINTHPFINDKYALIHNGVVHNIGSPVERISTNDTEFILAHYTLGGIDRVASSVSGYYACGLLDLETGNTIVFRDSTARLFVAWVKKFETYVFGTTRDVVQAACSAIGIKRVRIREASTNFHVVFDRNGDFVSSSNFTPIGRSFGELDKLSLGASVDAPMISEAVVFDKWRDDLPEAGPDEYRFYDCDGTPMSPEEYESLTYQDQINCRVEYQGRRVG